jgi:hypothetical protein
MNLFKTLRPLAFGTGLALCLGAADLATAQRGGGRGGQDRDRGPLEVHEAPSAAGIAWFGTWDAALAEAKRTKRPILLMSAAPQCQNVPGVW